jgi:Mlc titration factor MtfA (ptsG expression regulator)
MPNLQKEVLKENYKFYKRLSTNKQRLFEHRVLKFIEHHDFIGKDGIQVTHKMQLLISGTAVMLSFGFREYLYSLFSKIIIYPENYYSNFTQTQNKGEANPKYGVVVFSWEDFKAGLAIEDDNFHLGIHEFTHALHFSYKFRQTREGNNFLANFRKILVYMEDKSVQKKLINSGYIREYAFENQYEFLAVLVEHLYETPEKFKQELPIIYKLIVRLMKIDKIFLN